jgi:pyruvate dehydrogenase E1 component
MPTEAREGILRGLHRIKACDNPQVRLLGAGPLLKEAIAAATLLEEQFGITSEVWSVTSFSELARDGIACERARRLQQSATLPWITQLLSGSAAPVIAVSDYVRAVAESVRAYVPAPYVSLGTDGFGRSDTRAALRDFFEVDARWIAYIALTELDAGQPTANQKTPAEWRAIAQSLGLNLDQAGQIAPVERSAVISASL